MALEVVYRPYVLLQGKVTRVLSCCSCIVDLLITCKKFHHVTMNHDRAIEIVTLKWYVYVMHRARDSYTCMDESITVNGKAYTYNVRAFHAPIFNKTVDFWHEIKK